MYDIARGLIDIVPLLGADLKPESFYPLVEDYVRLLSSPLHLLDEATAKFASVPEDDTCERINWGRTALRNARRSLMKDGQKVFVGDSGLEF